MRVAWTILICITNIAFFCYLGYLFIKAYKQDVLEKINGIAVKTGLAKKPASAVKGNIAAQKTKIIVTKPPNKKPRIVSERNVRITLENDTQNARFDSMSALSPNHISQRVEKVDNHHHEPSVPDEATIRSEEGTVEINADNIQQFMSGIPPLPKEKSVIKTSSSSKRSIKAFFPTEEAGLNERTTEFTAPTVKSEEDDLNDGGTQSVRFSPTSQRKRLTLTSHRTLTSNRPRKGAKGKVSFAPEAIANKKKAE